jgi:hypothetical protein
VTHDVRSGGNDKNIAACRCFFKILTSPETHAHAGDIRRTPSASICADITVNGNTQSHYRINQSPGEMD